MAVWCRKSGVLNNQEDRGHERHDQEHNKPMTSAECALATPAKIQQVNEEERHLDQDDHNVAKISLANDIIGIATTASEGVERETYSSFQINCGKQVAGEYVEGLNCEAEIETDIDADGFRVEHRYETECVSRSKEVRDLSDECTELRLRETKEVTLEELKSKDVEARPATFEELRALLGAQFDGEEEIEIGREVVVEEFTRVESQRKEMIAGKVIASTVSVTEEHKTEEIHDSPEHSVQPGLISDDYSVTATDPTVDPEDPAIPTPAPAPDQVAQPSETDQPHTDVLHEVSSRPPPQVVERSPQTEDSKNESALSPQKEKSKGGKFSSLFVKKKSKKTFSDSTSFEGKLDLDENSEDGKKHKIQKRFSFGGKTSVKPTVAVKGDQDKKSASKSTGFGFFSLKRGKPKECVKVSADLYNGSLESSPRKCAEDDNTPEQEVYAVEGEGRIIVKTSSKSPLSSPDGGLIVAASDELLADVPVSADGRHIVVVAIDFGTTFSGYAFSFVNDSGISDDQESALVTESSDAGPAGSLPGPIHMMRRWEGGDPGVINQKTPTTLLLTPEKAFHSFGFTARNFYHDLDPSEAQRWLYFEKFKMTLHNDTSLNRTTTITATNGVTVPALTVFSHALRHFSQQALREISEQSMTSITNDDVRWVITVPAIWSAAAKQLMRQAAYNAGISSQQSPEQLIIALEPEAASIYIRKLRLSQLVPQRATGRRVLTSSGDTPDSNREPGAGVDLVAEGLGPGTKYMVVDCGGGTVDITVHELDSSTGKLKELFKASGGPYGSTGIDNEFERLLEEMFTAEFVKSFKQKRPAGWVDLMIAFESRKRAADPNKEQPLNVSLPFSFIDFHKKHFGTQVETAIKKHGDKDVRWSAQGMLRFMPEAMQRLYRSTLDSIKTSISQVLSGSNIPAGSIEYMFLVGGFAESPMLQSEIRKEFGQQIKIVIPQEASLAILKGAVCFGLDPTTVAVRRSRQTYGVGVARRFVRGRHPESKLLLRDESEWCLDVFDKFVGAGNPVFLGGSVTRPYVPADRDQSASVIHVYCSDADDVQFVTDVGVRRCGTLRLDLVDLPPSSPSSAPEGASKRPRVIQTKMTFGGTEIRMSAVDVATGQSVRCAVDFLSQ